MQREFSLLVTHTCMHSHPQEEQPGAHYCQKLTPPVCQALGQGGACLWNTAHPRPKIWRPLQGPQVGSSSQITLVLA